MRRSLFRILIVILTITFTLGSAAAYFFLVYPRGGPLEEVTLEGTASQVARGRYLTTHVMTCVDCHSQRDWTRFSGPLVVGTEGAGGARFDQTMGVPGVVYSTNFTPVGLGTWSDAEVIRAVTTGVSPDGSVAHPVMPFPAYRHLCEDDAKAMVAFLRTLAPSGSNHPEPNLDFMTRLKLRVLPEPWAKQPCPDPADLLASGRYLAQIANCSGCHTPHSGLEAVPEDDLSGGDAFPMPGGVVIASNLSPDGMSGLGGWDLDVFVETFHRYSGPNHQPPVVPAGKRNTVMAWTMYAGLTDGDLEAIFTYLQSLPPVENPLEVWQPTR